MASPMTTTVLDADDYAALLAQAKEAVREAQVRAYLAVKTQLIGLTDSSVDSS
jgi:hypothetical protein